MLQMGKNYFWKKIKSNYKGGFFFVISTYMGSFVSPWWDFDQTQNLASSYKGF